MNAWKRFIATLFRGSESGQSVVEYLFIVGACALVGIAGFTRYGKALKNDLGANARHIEGDGLPNTEGILSSLGADYNELPGWCVKPNYCFAAGTPVQTEHGDRPIESVRAGDRIWARDVNSGAIALRPVVNTYRTPRVPVVDLELSTGFGASEHLFVTPNHLFWVENAGWLPADALAAQPLWSLEAPTEAQLAESRLAFGGESTTVYNLEVSEFHSYFVGHSHVLVHNGDPDSASCPSTPAVTAPVASASPVPRPKLECGEHGTYRWDLGGGGATPKQHRDANGMERDHIPSGAALETRAERIFDQMVEDAVAEECRDLTAEGRKQLEKEVAAYKKAARGSLHTAVTDAAFAATLPIPLHKLGRTRGSKNKKGMEPLPGGVYDEEDIAWVKQYERDSEDLYAAAQQDIKAYEDLLGLGDEPGTYGQELSDECRELIQQALDRIRNKSDDDYEKELTQVAQKKLDADRKFKSLVDSNCPDPAPGSSR